MSQPFVKSVELVGVKNGDRVVFSESEEVVYDPINLRKDRHEVQEVVVKIEGGFQKQVELIKNDGEKLYTFPQIMVREIANGQATIHTTVTHFQDMSSLDHLTQRVARGYQANFTWKVEKPE